MDTKFGGIRLIVVGNVWRRLAAKCVSVHSTNTLADYGSPLQLGIGYRVVVRLRCSQQGVSHRSCLGTISSLSWNPPMHLIAYTEISCWKESVRWPGAVQIDIWRIVTTLRFNLAIFLFHRRRGHSRVIHLEGFFLPGHTSVTIGVLDLSR